MGAGVREGALAPQSGRTITEEDWKKALERAAANFPLQADFLDVYKRQAYGFVLAHNHPSGNPAPSRPDDLLDVYKRQAVPPVNG